MREEPVQLDSAFTGDVSRRARHPARFRYVDERPAWLASRRSSAARFSDRLRGSTRQRVEFTHRQGRGFREARIVTVLTGSTASTMPLSRATDDSRSTP